MEAVSASHDLKASIDANEAGLVGSLSPVCATSTCRDIRSGCVYVHMCEEYNLGCFVLSSKINRLWYL